MNQESGISLPAQAGNQADCVILKSRETTKNPVPLSTRSLRQAQGRLFTAFRMTICAFFIFNFAFLIVSPAQAQFQILPPTPGASCGENDECRRTICPQSPVSICNMQGKCVGGVNRTATAPEGAIPCNFTLEDMIGTGVRFVTLIFGITGSLALLFLIYGGFKMLTAAGNPEHVQEGRKILTGSLMGVIIILGAGLIVQFVGRLVLPRSAGQLEQELRVPGVTAGLECVSNEDCGGRNMVCQYAEQDDASPRCVTDCEAQYGWRGYFCQYEREGSGLECIAELCPGSDPSFKCCGPSASP